MEHRSLCRGFPIVLAVALLAAGALETEAAEPLGLAAPEGPSPAAPLAPLSEDERIVHVLNRLGYGPAPGDIERLRSMGIDAYIEEQLQPQDIAEPELDALIEEFRSFDMGLAELRETYQPVARQGRRARASGREKRDELNAGHGERVGVWSAAEGLDDRRFRWSAMKDRPGDYEILAARLIRAARSRRQLHELMVDFWANHFSMQLGDHYYAAHYESQVVRPLAFGRFEDLLLATATHPAMLEYLDNYRSAAAKEILDERIAALRAGDLDDRLELRRRMPYLRENEGLNENFARELMELHTLGVDGGYTQDDVEQVARCLTGWTVTGGRDGEGEFYFDALLHEPGDKVVLGRTIEAGGMDEGLEVIRMLARHPSTARFVSTKLVRRFIADEPPESVVQAAAATFLETDGDIREVLRTIFASPEFFAPEYHRAKLKKPLELVASALRATGASFGGNDPIFGSVLSQLGERLYAREAPDGYPDYAEAWLNTNSLLTRIRFAFDLVSEGFPLVDVDLEAARSLLREMGLPEPSVEQLDESQRLAAMAPKPGSEGQTMQQQQMMANGGGGESAAIASYTPQQLAVATMLGSPRFQKR